MLKNERAFKVNRILTPPSCLPADLDPSRLMDITALGDPWRRYVDPETKEVHDCAKYWNEAQLTQNIEEVTP